MADSAPIPTLRYLDEKGSLSKECTHTIEDEVLVRGLEAMITTQLFDERMLILQRQGYISFALGSRGEEACAVASAAALTQDDWLYPQYREAGVMFWRGYGISPFVHHMFCNRDDIIKGRQMPNHFGSRDLNVVTVSSSLASKIPQAAGAAYAMKLQKKPSVTVSYFGDGSASEGDFHVGLNFAAVRKAPVIFFCRNNGYAISTPQEDQYAGDGIASRGPGYGIKTVRLDGNDFFAIHEQVSQAREYCLAGNGPVLIEAMTYRMGAHSTSDDPTQYRTDAEVAAWERRCPIQRLRAHLNKRKLWSLDQEKELTERVRQELDEAVERARHTPPPELHSMIEDVYEQVPAELEEQLKQATTQREVVHG